VPLLSFPEMLPSGPSATDATSFAWRSLLSCEKLSCSTLREVDTGSSNNATVIPSGLVQRLHTPKSPTSQLESEDSG
jgi:hypothetical protein